MHLVTLQLYKDLYISWTNYIILLMDKVNLKTPSLEFFKSMLISLGYLYLLLQNKFAGLLFTLEKVQRRKRKWAPSVFLRMLWLRRDKWPVRDDLGQYRNSRGESEATDHSVRDYWPRVNMEQVNSSHAQKRPYTVNSRSTAQLLAMCRDSWVLIYE